MRTLSIKKFMGEELSLIWLVEDLLPNVGWTLLCGQRGCGKTTFAVQLCMAIESGKPFIGRRTAKARTLYIQADSPTIEWQHMLKRICPEAPGGYTSIDVRKGVLGYPDDVKYLKDVVGQYSPGFIVFDSLYKLASKQINNEAVLEDVDTMESIADGIPWLVIHHPPHGESRAAGSNSIGGNCSNDWFLSKTTLTINKGRLVKDEAIRLGKDTTGRWIAKGEETDATDLSYEDILNHRIG